MNNFTLLICGLLSVLTMSAQTSFPLVKIDVERLPNMQVPRFGHATFCTNGEIVAIGGHTSGFVPTATAEYLKDGEWHLLQTVYPHDDGVALSLKSGKILLAGGHQQSLGIGQTFPVEMYDPVSHTFSGFGCLDKKRALASAIEMENGRVVIAGNHQGNDAIECFDGKKFFNFVKDVKVWHATPYIFKIAKDDAIIFGSRWNGSQDEPCDTVDCLKGEPFCVPLLKTWIPMGLSVNHLNGNSCIGDESQGDYSYLISAHDKKGRLGFIKVQGKQFSLLRTNAQVPMNSPWGSIHYTVPLTIDKTRQVGYVVGFDYKNRIYVLAINYAHEPARLTLYYTGPGYQMTQSHVTMTPDGDLLLTGGINSDNFKPFNTVYLMRFGTRNATSESAIKPWVWWLAEVLVILLAVIVIWWVLRRNRKKKVVPTIAESEDKSLQTSYADAGKILLMRIRELMETEKLFLNSELKVSDVAARLGTNSNYVASSIKSGEGLTFSQFVNRYRIEHALQLIRNRPEIKASSLCMEAGFSNETSFFRTFKAITGMTPNEWRMDQQLPVRPKKKSSWVKKQPISSEDNSTNLQNSPISTEEKEV